MEMQLVRIKQAYNDSSPINSIEALDKFYRGALESFRGTVPGAFVDRTLQLYENPDFLDVWQVHCRIRGFYQTDTQLIYIDDNLKKTPISRRQTSIEECIHFLQAAQMQFVPNSTGSETINYLKTTEQTAKIIRHLGIAGFSPHLLRQDASQCDNKAFAIFALYDFIEEKLPTNYVAKLDTYEKGERYEGVVAHTINNEYRDFVRELYNFSQATLGENLVPYNAINSVAKQQYLEGFHATLKYFFPEDSKQTDIMKTQRMAFMASFFELRDFGDKENIRLQSEGYNYQEEIKSRIYELYRNKIAEQAVRKL